MSVIYTVSGQGRSEPGPEFPLDGHVVIESMPASNGAVLYGVSACLIVCNGGFIGGYGEETGFLRFMAVGDPGQINVGGANWQLAAWQNDATGAWFADADGTRYPGDIYADQAQYLTLPPRIELCGDNVLGGPFTPVGAVLLDRAPVAPLTRPSAPKDIYLKD